MEENASVIEYLCLQTIVICHVMTFPSTTMIVALLHYNGAENFLLPSDVVATVMRKELNTRLWLSWCKQTHCTTSHIKVHKYNHVQFIILDIKQLLPLLLLF